VAEKIHVKAIGHHTITQDPAGFGERFENRGLVPVPGQLGGTTQTARSGSHDGDLLQPRPGCLKDLETAPPGVLNEKPLDLANLDRSVITLGSALGGESRAASFFAEDLGGAQNAACPSQDIVLFDGTDCTGDILEAQFTDELRRLGSGGATRRAGRVVTQQAPIGFCDRLSPTKSFGHPAEIIPLVQNSPPPLSRGVHRETLLPVDLQQDECRFGPSGAITNAKSPPPKGWGFQEAPCGGS